MNKTLASILVTCLLSISLRAADENSLQVSGFEDPIKAQWKHQTRANHVPFTAEKAEGKVKEGLQSAKWTNLNGNKWIELLNTPSDWSAWEAISLWIYSESANGQKINLVVAAPTEASKEGYYLHQFTVDWTGWHQLVIPFKTFKRNRNPAPWSSINALRITAGGWGAEPLADTILYLDDLRLIRR